MTASKGDLRHSWNLSGTSPTLPDVLIPGKAQYEDPRWPEERLYVVGVKTTCKDRWRQVLNGAKREGNRKRDARKRQALRRAGWEVLTIWECELRAPDKVALKLRAFLGAPMPRRCAVGVAQRQT